MIKEKLSVIIPVYNESKNIIPLYKELKEELSKNFEDFEIIYINDGSQDNSLQELLSLKDVVILDLNKNYGQSIAFDCGFKHGTGYYFVTLDGDGQNDPKDIKRLYDELINKNLEVVSGFRKNRKDKKGILLLSKLGRYLRQRIIQDTVRDTGCSLRIYKRVTINSLDLYGEMHRYILAILRWKGFKIGELEVNDRVRIHGESKYNYSKSIRGFIDLLYIWFIQKHYNRPMHLFGMMSLIFLFFSFFSGFLSIYEKLFLNINLNNNGWFFISIFSFLASILLFSFGIIIDLLIKINYKSSTNDQKVYIRNIYNQ